MKDPRDVALELKETGERGKNLDTTPVPAGYIVAELLKLGVQTEMTGDFTLLIPIS